MSTPHIEHFVDERGNFIYRAEFEGSFLSKDEAKELAKYVSGVLDENDKLRGLVRFANKTVEGLCGLVENSPGCSMCPLNQDEDRACGAAELFSRMRELGVEL